MKLCCKGDHEYMKGIPAIVDSGLIATAWALKPGNPNSTVHIWKKVGQALSGSSSQIYSAPWNETWSSKS